MEQRELIQYFESIGFVFNQTEEGKRGKEIVVIDCFPHLYESGENQSFWFSDVVEFESKLHII